VEKDPNRVHRIRCDVGEPLVQFVAGYDRNRHVAGMSRGACARVDGVGVLEVRSVRRDAFREVVCNWIAAQPGLSVGRAVADGNEALAEVERWSPDVILMDARMPGLDGIAATRLIKARPDAPPVVILTLHDSPTTRRTAEEAGADGFVVKTDLVSTLPEVLRSGIGSRQGPVS
jgi:CheY-like chemotaxis protein